MKMTIKTNYNNKLHCQVMVHVSAAPKKLVGESVMDATEVEIHTEDGSYPPTRWKLLSFIRVPLGNIPDSLTLPSHAMDSYDFYAFAKNIHQSATPAMEMAAYYYKKIQS